MSASYMAVMAANIASFVAGMSLSWSSPEISKMNHTSTMPFDKLPTADEFSWISSLMPLGAACGPFIFGYCADRFGRRLTILSFGIPYLGAYLMQTFAKIIPLFYVSRFFIGLMIGGSFTVLPMYIGEISTDQNRGAFGSIMNCFICLGLLLSYGIGPFVSVAVFNGIITIFPGLFLIGTFFMVPETAHYYASKGDEVAARKALAKIRGTADIDEELSEIKTMIESSKQGSVKDLFTNKGLVKSLVISMALVIFQQMSGINAVLFYAQNIFKASNTSLGPEYCSMFIGATQFITSFITPLAADRLGRRLLFILSAIGMIIAEVPLGIYFILKDGGKDVSAISWLPILTLIFYIITYNSGFGPLPWAVMGELFPGHVKSFASSLTASICWFIGFLITKYFEAISNSIGIGVSFLIFAGFCVAALLFSLFFLIETKGKSVAEIQAILNK